MEPPRAGRERVPRRRLDLRRSRRRLRGPAPGRDLGYSEYREITQDRVNPFADAADDHQWFHVDPRWGEADHAVPHGPDRTVQGPKNVVVDELPRTASGKVRKLDLRQRFSG